MAGFSAILLSYLLGGITFLPLLLLALACHAYLTLPCRTWPQSAAAAATAAHDGASAVSSDFSAPSGAHLAKQPSEPDVVAAYFAVCREYVPGGVNGKPPERTTPAGQTITAESPSVYQSMYRSIFERGKTQSPTIEAGKPVKKARNVFFVVLRHGHLVLFDNSDQIEVRHVISLDHHEVDVYGGGGTIPEGELWIKRNCIRLNKKKDDGSAPFFLFSDNCSEKEDLYYAILKTQGQRPLPVPTDDMIKLIRQLHASDDNLQTRWLNALLGRLFLALYKTASVEQLIRDKITKKISRVAKPAFITNLRLEDIDMGDSGPFFNNPRLREMTVDGTLTLETDVRYTGNFKAVIAAVARIELGTRFKAREVDMILAGVLKKLEGHLLVKIKPPPSNRLWISFESLPRLDISLEPIVSSRQITYGVILRAIQSRIREVFGETLVLPNWDDIPFTNTENNTLRSGIWDHESVGPKTSPKVTQLKQASEDAEDAVFAPPERQSDESRSPPASPVLLPSSSSSVGIESGDPKPPLREKPKAMRSNSFAAAADPIISKSPATIEGVRKQQRKGQRDATAAMRTLAQHSPETSPTMMPVKTGLDSPVKPSLESSASGTLDGFASDETEARKLPSLIEVPTTDVNEFRLRNRGVSLTEPVTSAKSSAGDRAKGLNQSLSTATTAAKNWSWGMLSRQGERSTPEKPNLNEPIGRGQPLPPPGMPLPRPDKNNNWSVAAFGSLRRKPVGQGIGPSSLTNTSNPGTPGPGSSPSLLPQRRPTRQHSHSHSHGAERDSVLTIAAPAADSSFLNTPTDSDAMETTLPDFDLGVSESSGMAEQKPSGNEAPRRKASGHGRSTSVPIVSVSPYEQGGE